MNEVRKNIDAYKDNIIADITELVAVKSVGGDAVPGGPFGEGPTKAMHKFVEIAGRLGFRTGTFEEMVGWAEVGEPDQEMVAVLAHMDVVPEGDGWSIEDPYRAVVKDGAIYGRGVVDNKGAAVSALYAIKSILDAGIKLEKRVRVIVGTNEERGSKAIAHYVASGQETPVAGFTPDAHYPLINGEKGSITGVLSMPFAASGDVQILEMGGGLAANSVPDKARAVVKVAASMKKRFDTAVKDWVAPRGASMQVEDKGDGQYEVRMNGIPFHGATPWNGSNAVAHLIGFLRLVLSSGEQKKALDAIGMYVGEETRGESLGLCRYDDISGFTSMCMGTLNKVGDKVEFSLNYRYPVTFGLKDLSSAFDEAMKTAGFSIVSASRGEPLYVPEDAPLVKNLMKAFVQETGITDQRPYSIGGGTYAKAMPNILAFGTTFQGESPMIHEADEHWNIENMMKSTKITAAAVIELCNSNL